MMVGESSLPTMTQPELAERLGVTTTYVWMLQRDGVISPQRFGNFPVYSEDDYQRAKDHIARGRRGRRSDLFRPVGDLPPEAYISQADAASKLGVNPRTVARWIELGKLQAWAQGLVRSEVEALAAQLRPELRPPPPEP